MPSLTTEGSRAASCTKANKQAPWIDFKFEISALILPNDTSAVRGSSQDRRAGTFNSIGTPTALAPDAASDEWDNRPPILPSESLSAIVTSPGDRGKDKWATINAFESLILLSRVRTVVLIAQYYRRERFRLCIKKPYMQLHHKLFNYPFPVYLTSQLLSSRWVGIQ